MTVRTAGVRELGELALTPGRAFGIYVHVPFWAARCGYCDFNTYTPAELGGMEPDSWQGRPRRGAGRDTCPLHAGRRRRGDHGGEPGVDVTAAVGAPARGRLHPGLAGHA